MLAIVEAGSFSGAARRLNRAQSAVTYAVQRLEEQLGLALFDRDRPPGPAGPGSSRQHRRKAAILNWPRLISEEWFRAGLGPSGP